MDYLNNIRPDLVDHQPRHAEAPQDHNNPASHHDLNHQQHSQSQEQRTNEALTAIHRDLHDNRAIKHDEAPTNHAYDGSGNYHTADLQQSSESDQDPNENIIPETTRGPQSSEQHPADYSSHSVPHKQEKTPKRLPEKHSRHIETELQYQEELIHQQKERQHAREEQKLREQREMEKRIRDRLDDERKAEEERIKLEEERRQRRRERKQRKRDEAEKDYQSRLRAQQDAEYRHSRQHEDNSILDKYPSLNLDGNNTEFSGQQNPVVFPAKATHPRQHYNNDFRQDERFEIEARYNHNGFDQDTKFVIEPRFKTEDEYVAVQELVPQTEIAIDEQLSEEEIVDQSDEPLNDEEYFVPIVDKRTRDIQEVKHGYDQGRSEQSSGRFSSSSSSSSSSSMSSSSSSISSSSSGDDWVSGQGGYHTMEEDEVHAYEKWMQEKRQKRRRAHIMEEELLNYEEQRRRQEMSAGHYSGQESSSEPTSSSEGDRSKRDHPSRDRGNSEGSSLDYGYGLSDSGKGRSPAKVIDSDRALHSDDERHASEDERAHVRHQQHAMRDLHEKYEHEIAEVQSDEEHYYRNYQQLQQEMEQMAEMARRARHQAKRDAEEADKRAAEAERKVHEAEERAIELEIRAKQAEKRASRLEKHAKEADKHVQEVEHEWDLAERKAKEHETKLKEARRIAEIEQQERIHAEKRVADREHELWLANREYQHQRDRYYDDEFYYQDNSDDYQEADDIPMTDTEPVSYMKHDKKHHKKIRAERRQGKKGLAKAGETLLEDPDARKKAKRAIEENPELAKKAARKIAQMAQDDPRVAKVARELKQWEEERDTEKRQEEDGQWGHARTIYPESYQGERYELETIRRNPKEEQDKRPDHKEKDKRERRGDDPRPKTVYPASYTPPRIDDNEQDSKKKSVSPMVQKHVRPIDKGQEVEEQRSQWFRDEPDYEYETTPVSAEDQLLEAELEVVEEFGRELADEAAYARHHYTHQPLDKMQTKYYAGENLAVGSSMIEENEKERALELFKVSEEDSLKQEYDRRISELASDYQRKLRDLDTNYSEKKTELDHERQEIQRSASIYQDSFDSYHQKTFAPFYHQDSHREPVMFIDPTPRPLYHEIDPHSRTFDDTEFGFGEDQPFVGLNLAQKPTPEPDTKDPMADIKRRERDLQSERLARESELKRDFEKRLEEYELDFQQKENELEKEKLVQERRMIAEREDQLDLENQEARRKLKRRKREVDEQLYYDEDEGDSEADELAGDYGEETFDDSYDWENGEFTEGDQADLQQSKDKLGKDDYEIEWELDAVPKRAQKPKSSKPKTSEPAPASKKSKKDKKGKKKESRKNSEKNEKNEKTSRKQKRRNQEDPERRHGQRHQNGMAYDQEYYQIDDYDQVEGFGFETFELPRPHYAVPRVPARYERPTHPLASLYPNLLHTQKPGAPLPTRKVQNPDQKYGPEVFQGTEFAGLHRERYGPQDHDRFVEQQPERDHYAKMVEHGEYDDYYVRPTYTFTPQERLSQNTMSTRTFPQLKTHMYNPDDMAKSLAKAHKHGLVAPQEDEIPLHRSMHRYQAKSFDDIKDEQNIDTKSAHKDHSRILDGDGNPDKKVPVSQKSQKLKPKEPKDIKHVTDLQVKPPSSEQYKQKQQRQKRKEEKRDQIPSVADLKPEDVEMLQNPHNLSIEKAFQKSQSDYYQHRLVKPRFDDFKLQFEGPNSQVADKISSEDSVDFAKIAYKRAQAQQGFKERNFDKVHPIDPVHGGRYSYDSPHIMQDSYSFDGPVHESYHNLKESSRNEQRRLEELGIGLDDFFDLSSQQKLIALPQKVDQAQTKSTDQKQRKTAASQLQTQKEPTDQKTSSQKAQTQSFSQTKKKPQSSSYSKIQQPKPQVTSYTSSDYQKPMTESSIPTQQRSETKSYNTPYSQQRPQPTGSYMPAETQKPIVTSMYAISPVASTESDYPLSLDIVQKYEDPSQHDLQRAQQHQRSKQFEQSDYELPVFDPSTEQRRYAQQQQGPQQAPWQQPYQLSPYATQQQPQYVQQQLQQPQIGSYMPQAPPSQYGQQASMYQTPPQWYTQPLQQQQPTMLPSQRSTYSGYATPQSTSLPLSTQFYPSTPYMPPQYSTVPQSYQGSSSPQMVSPKATSLQPTVTPLKSLPYQPRPMATSPSSKQQPTEITMTRDLTQEPSSGMMMPLSSAPSSATQKTQNYQNEVDGAYHEYGDNYDFESSDEDDYAHHDIVQTYSYMFDNEHDGHPVFVTSSEPHSYISHHDDEYIIADNQHHMFLDSRHDFDESRVSNNYLQ